MHILRHHLNIFSLQSPKMLTVSTSRTEALVSKSVFIFIFTILLFCNSAFSDEKTRPPGESRHPKQPAGFFEWLFGSPVKHINNINDRVDSSTSAPIIYHQLTRTKNKNSGGTQYTSNKHASSGDQDPDHLSEVHMYQSPTTSDTDTTNSSTTTSISNSTSSPENVGSSPTRRIILLPKPRPRNFRSPIDQSQSPPENNFRQIQITDIQHAIGTEINEDELNSDPGQVNLQGELDAIDRLEKNLTDNSKSRARRATSSKFRQLNIPYGHGHGEGDRVGSNNHVPTIGKRQLLISPAEQQMYAIQAQQQELAAASMLRQQQFLNPYGRYSNRYIDDYYDDDSSYEDSDEYYDHYNRRGLLPIVAAMRQHGVRVPPIHHPYGIGRRSLPDEVDAKLSKNGANPQNLQTMQKQGKSGVGGNWGKLSQRVREDSFLGPISKGGRWGTIEDYDLSSDFNKVTRRKGMTSRDDGKERHKELDEEEEEKIFKDEEKALNLFQKSEKGRSSLGWGLVGKERQEELNITTSTSSGTPEITTPIPVPASNATETPTLEEEETSTGSSGEETTTSNPNVASTDPEEEEATSSTGTTTVTSTTSSKPKPTSKPRPTTVEPAILPPFHQNLNCRCGMQSVRGHDIGDDTIVRAMVNPWLVAVRAKGKHLCSGSIINNKYILTSKNCVHGVKGLVATAGLGSGIPKNFSVIRVNEHSTRNIALLKVKPAITPNFAMRPICLPIRYLHDSDHERSNVGTGTLVTFKKSSQKGSPGLQLVQTEVPMLSSSKCSNSPGFTAGSGSICPGPPGTMKCGGDPGGVLQVYHKGYSYEQIGTVSTTVGCRANKTPGVYTDIRKSVKWILHNTKDARYCRKPKVTQKDLSNAKKVKVDVESDFKEELDEEGQDDEGWRSDEFEEDEENWARSHK